MSKPALKTFLQKNKHKIMQIYPIQKNEYKINYPSFTRWRREAYVFNKGMIHRNDTHFFRETHAWLDLISFIEKKFKNIPRINVYNYGCSDRL